MMNYDEKSGEIQLVLGPMFSCKSSELIKRIRLCLIAQQTCLIVNYHKDVRYGENVVSTHDKEQMKAIACKKLKDIYKKAKNFDVIGIDEGQFFPDIVTFAEDMANLGKRVIIAALDGDFQRKPFGSVLQLIPMAEQVVKLNALCSQCFKPAAFSKRTVENNDQELIGGAESYQPACRKCFFKKHPQSTPKKKVKVSSKKAKDMNIEKIVKAGKKLIF